MAIDIAARKRIIEERSQKSLISQLVSSLTPPDKPDTVTEPLNRVAEGVNRGGNISTILVAFVQSLLKAVKDIGSKSPSSSDVKEVTTAIQAIAFPEVKIPETVTLDPNQKDEIVGAVKDIKFPEQKEFPKKMDVGIAEVVKKLSILSDILSNLQKDKISKIDGTVNIRSMPELNLAPLVRALQQNRVDLPKQSKEASKIDLSPITSALNELNDNVIALTDLSGNEDVIGLLRQVSEGISSLYSKPSFVPPAVTNVNINALQGVVKTTAMTISTSAVAIPTSAVENRRSIQIYNNSSNTLYIGGSDVTTSNGIPVSASSFSQALDMGQNMTLYGVATGSSNIRVLEISSEASGR